MLPAQAHVEVGITRPQAGIAPSANWTFVGCVVVAVDLAPGEQVKGMTAVVGENWRQLETAHDLSLPRAVEYAGNYHLVALVKLRETAVEAQVRRILRPVVAVEVRGSVEALAESVVSQE